MVARILGEGKERLHRVNYFGVVLWQGSCPSEGLFIKRRRNRFWKRLKRVGISQALLPEKLREEAALWGIRAVSPAPLRQAMLPELLQLWCPGKVSVASLRASGTDTAVYRAAEELGNRARYLLLEVPRGGTALAEHLRRRWGLSVGAPEGRAETGICFQGPPRYAELCLGEDCGQYQQVEYQVGGHLMDEQTAALLWQCGLLKRENIRPLSVHCRLDTQMENIYNAKI